jgi:hypothetical protein
MLFNLSSRDNFDTTNKYRFERMYNAMNQGEACVFLAVGLRFDHEHKTALPCIVGSEWISREEAIELLRTAITALDTKLIEDAEQKKV